MFGRSFLLLACVILPPALGTGCLLDAGPYGNEGGSGTTGTSVGAGGSGAGTSTSTSSTAGGSGGTTTTTTTSSTSTVTCTVSCDDGLPCTDDACVDGACKSTPTSSGIAVSNTAPNDCKREVCDGQGQVVPVGDDSESPGLTGDQCSDWVCSGGSPVQAAKNQGQSCNVVYDAACQTPGTCQGILCLPGNLPDSSVDVPPCGTVSCSGGVSSGLVYDSSKCEDPNVSDCKVAECGPGAANAPICYGVNAPQGQSCLKFGQYNGQCNSGGHCCNMNGCD